MRTSQNVNFQRKLIREVLLRNEYLAKENRILRKKLGDKVHLTPFETLILTNLKSKIKNSLFKTLPIAISPQNYVDWIYRCNRKKVKRKKGRPPISKTIMDLIFQMKLDNLNWGITRVQGALKNLGFKISIPTITKILKENGFPLKPKKSGIQWESFLKSNDRLISACDFFKTRVIRGRGYENVFVLFFIHLDTREVHIGGITRNPNSRWVNNVLEIELEKGFLRTRKYLIHDNDITFGFIPSIMERHGKKSIRLPPYSPNLNAYAERFVQTVKTECLRHHLVFDISTLWNILDEFLEHYHFERNHQGKNNLLLFGNNSSPQVGQIVKISRLGGILNYYTKKVA